MRLLELNKQGLTPPGAMALSVAARVILVEQGLTDLLVTDLTATIGGGALVTMDMWPGIED